MTFFKKTRQHATKNETMQIVLNDKQFDATQSLSTKDVYFRLCACLDREIELVWKRAVFLTAFLIAAFAGYGGLIAAYIGIGKPRTGTFAEISIAAICISFVGMALSVIWIMMAKGSKAWQEHYEKVIECYVNNHENGKLQRYSGGDYCKLVANELNTEGPKKEEPAEPHSLEIEHISNWLFNTSGGCYSVSRIVIRLGHLFFLVWTAILSSHLVYLIRHGEYFYDKVNVFLRTNPKSSFPFIIAVVAAGIGVAAMFFWLLFPTFGMRSRYLQKLHIVLSKRSRNAKCVRDINR